MRRLLRVRGSCPSPTSIGASTPGSARLHCCSEPEAIADERNAKIWPAGLAPASHSARASRARRARDMQCAVAVAQTLGHNGFLCVCDKAMILGRVISVSQGPCRPPGALLRGQPKRPLSVSYNPLGLCDGHRGKRNRGDR
jgi:hypothetical protein